MPLHRSARAGLAALTSPPLRGERPHGDGGVKKRQYCNSTLNLQLVHAGPAAIRSTITIDSFVDIVLSARPISTRRTPLYFFPTSLLYRGAHHPLRSTVSDASVGCLRCSRGLDTDVSCRPEVEALQGQSEL